jgi:hypothetical protein
VRELLRNPHFLDSGHTGGGKVVIHTRPPALPQQSLLVRFEVFTAVTMKNAVFWDVMPCCSCKNRRFGESHSACFICYLLLTFLARRLGFSETSNSDVHSALIPPTLMMEAMRSSETSFHTRVTLRHVPEDVILHSPVFPCCEAFMTGEMGDCAAISLTV